MQLATCLVLNKYEQVSVTLRPTKYLIVQKICRLQLQDVLGLLDPWLVSVYIPQEKSRTR